MAKKKVNKKEKWPTKECEVCGHMLLKRPKQLTLEAFGDRILVSGHERCLLRVRSTQAGLNEDGHPIRKWDRLPDGPLKDIMYETALEMKGLKDEENDKPKVISEGNTYGNVDQFNKLRNGSKEKESTRRPQDSGETQRSEGSEESKAVVGMSGGQRSCSSPNLGDSENNSSEGSEKC